MKKQFFLLFAASLVAVLNVNAQTIKGDVNKDGTVDVSDVTTVVDIILHPTAIAKPVTAITLTSRMIVTDVKSMTEFTATVDPSDATLSDLVWTSSDPSVANFVNGYVIGFAPGTTTITATAADGSGVTASCEVTVTGGLMEHNYVNLGLPGNLLWATCNVGANEPTQYGDTFAWGETVNFRGNDANITWDAYKWCNGSIDTMTKYCTDSKYGYNGYVDDLIVLESVDDAATQQWGDGWRMPTQSEWRLLHNSTYCFWTWYPSGNPEFGVAGYKVESRVRGHEGKYIFLPAGFGLTDEFGPYGYYWSSSLSEQVPNEAFHCDFSSRNYFMNTNVRSRRYYIRPVKSLE